MEKGNTKVTIRFDEQQFQLLQSLKKKGKYGQNYQDIVLNVFRKYIDQKYGNRGV